MKNLNNLVSTILRFDDLTARQLVKNALYEGVDWSALEAPPSYVALREIALAEALAEMFAFRFGKDPPAWAHKVTCCEKPLYLDSKAYDHLVLKSYLWSVSPEPFKRRNIFTYANYLDVMV